MDMLYLQCDLLSPFPHHVHFYHKYEHISMEAFDRNQPFNHLPLLPPNVQLENYSQVLKKLVTAYYKLGAVTSRGDWIPWVLYMLDAVEKTLVLTNSLINDIVQQMSATLEHGKAKIKWYNKEVNEAIFSQPYCRFKTISTIMQTASRTTVTKYMSELEKAKILTPKKDGKEVFYVNDDLVRILQR
jgi:Fic family protein